MARSWAQARSWARLAAGPVRVGLLFALALPALIGAACFSPSAREKALKDAELHYQLGDGAFRDRNVPEALKELLQAVRDDPGHAQAHHLLGFVYMGRQEYDQALVHLKRATELKPDLYEAQNNLGTCLLALCRWEDAATVLRKLLLEPLYQTPHVAHNNLGMALLRLEQREEAIIHFQKAVFLNPTFCVAHNNNGMTLLELGRPEEAQLALNKAIAADPSCTQTYAEPHFHLGRLLERAGRLEQAQEHYRRCHELTRTRLVIGFGCGTEPIGPRCEQKLRQAGTLEPWSPSPVDRRR
ncbi:MAG: tetratricopeptide repeat protein [Deltaproteobacteria bacterium]|nr:tetratricopeptide repeat protein [Deltaproteobacteria bacterium]